MGLHSFLCLLFVMPYAIVFFNVVHHVCVWLVALVRTNLKKENEHIQNKPLTIPIVACSYYLIGKYISVFNLDSSVRCGLFLYFSRTGSSLSS